MRRIDDAERRRFLAAGVIAGGSLLLARPVVAASVAEMGGEVLVNGRRAMRDAVIRAGDTVKTGANAMLTFVVGADAFRLRAMSELVLEAKADSVFITGLRLVTGGLQIGRAHV